MNATKDISELVNQAIDDALEGVGEFDTNLLAGTIIASWAQPGGADEDKWRHCAFMAVTKIIADKTRRFRVTEETESSDETQLTFPNFPKIRRAYQVEGKTVRAEKMTVAQAMKVVDELRRVGRGVELHINDMMRFIDEVLLPANNGN